MVVFHVIARETLFKQKIFYNETYADVIQAPVPLTVFRSNSKFDQNPQCSG